MQDPTTQLDQSTINNLLNNANGGGGASLIPESLVTAMTVGFVVINVVSILFLVFYVISLIRKWKVQSAILHMQKDVAEIKTSLVKPAHIAPAQAPAKPEQSSRLIADEGEDSSAHTA